MQVHPEDSTQITVQRRSAIMALQNALVQQPERIDCPVQHHFAPGMYSREIFIPAGTVIIGKIHRHAHVNIISLGSCYVLTEDGPVEMQAPYTFVSKPGTKRVVHALTDVVWTTCHVTDETDLEKIEEQVIAPTYEALGMSDCTLPNQLEIKV